MKVPENASGTMRSGIAQIAATSGCEVKIFDTNQEALSKSKALLETTLSKLVEKAKIDGVKFGRTLGSKNPKTAAKIEKMKIFLRAGKSYDWITKELSVSKKTVADIKKSLPSLSLQLTVTQ
jgi:3-hydroxybutyryl-CoA dehydrogenase